MVRGSQHVSALPGTPYPWCGIPPSNHRAKLHRFKSQFPIGRRSPVTPQQPLLLLVAHSTPPWPRETPRPLMLAKIRAAANWFLCRRASCIHVSQVHLCHLCLLTAVELLSQHSNRPSGRKNSIRSWATPTGTTGSTRNNQGKHKPLPQELDLDL